MTPIDNFLHRNQKWGAIIFTTIVVSSTAYLLLQPLPSKKVEPKSPEEIAAVETWSKTKLFAYLARHQVYPDVDTDQRELIRLVKSILKLYPDMDAV